MVIAMAPVSSLSAESFPPPELAARARLQEISFERLPGFAGDDHLAAWTTLRKSCERLNEAAPSIRIGQVPSSTFQAFCSVALTAAPRDAHAARALIERYFAPWRIEPIPGANPYDRGFLTGYYEPEVAGSLERSADFQEPILSLPDDIAYTSSISSQPVLPSRAEIDKGALATRTRPVVWVRDGIEAFMIHVQGSARVRLPGGRLLRLAYAGRNGHPYTSIGKLLVDGGQIAVADMSLARLKQWVRDNGQGEGEPGRKLLQSNRSYVFYKALDNLKEEQGPVGGEGVELTPLRSIAVDRSLWHYGLPFWIDADLPDALGRTKPFRRLMIAQDTGTAIVGAARADIFYGTGDKAGALAGDIRHGGNFYVLLPRTGVGSR
ncbi:membrane-bound lytic murein transglycosylase A [Beijerinckia sp. GAS462]|nr:membrane-bound lytic murein transglycosylase A [Beijerinckia sp. GAS462]SED05161.1 membrane-bound lytic murein transglycosylase A [Beijerinckia sp. 28-YEA-48]